MIRINGTSKNRKEQSIIDSNNFVFDESKKINSKEVISENGHLKHLSNCLITLTPIISEEPFQLFGSKTKSLVANKLVITEALYNEKDHNDIKAGNTILEMLISDETLSKSILQSNSEDTNVTYSNIGGVNVDISDIEKLTNSIDDSEEDLEKDLFKLKGFFIEAKATLYLELDKARPSKKAIESVLISLSSSVGNLKENAEHSVSSLSNNLSKDINSVKMEIFSTIEKLNFYNKAESLKLEYIDDFSESLLYWIANGGFKGLDLTTYIQVLKQIKNPNENLRDQIDDLETKRDKQKKGEFNIAHGSFAIMQIRGDIPLCNEVGNRGEIIELRFSNGYVRQGYKTRVMSDNEFLRVSISLNDILYLLRGTKNTDFVLGTIGRYARQSVPLVRIKELEEVKVIQDNNFKTSDSHIKVQLNKVKTMLTGSLKKSERLAAKEELEILEAMFHKLKEELSVKGIKAQHELTEQFKTKLETSLKNEFATLPNNLLQKSLTILKDNDL